MIKIQVAEHGEIDIKEGASAKDLAEQLKLTAPNQAITVSINETFVDLSTQLKNGDQVSFWDFETPEGKEVYWHTSAHVLAQAVLRLYPDAKPTIGPPIENGFYYDFAHLQISETDLPEIEKAIQEVIKENHKSERESFKNKEEALKAFINNPYKCQIIEEIPEGDPLSGYRQGEFFDLCRGPHLSQLGKIKALKLTKTSGAYWKGDAKNEMLTRIYGISFPDRKLLKDYLEQLEEAKKRDHKVLGPKLDLFSLKEEAPGMPFIHPKGLLIWNELVAFLRQTLYRYDYVEIKTPTMMTKELWERSGHWANYRENMYISEIEEREFAIKPMNCPGCMLFYKSHVHSYRELPFRVAEIGHVHRHEPSGAISGLFRVRSFHQDDAHIFMMPEQIATEILATIKLFEEVYSVFGLKYHLELSTRPEEGTIGTDEEWEVATAGLKNALDASGLNYKINPGDGAFYGPKIDFHIKDALGRTWQCGTIQLDMALPDRFELEYTDKDGQRHRPIMIHRAVYGSIERFFGILIEHFAGRFPLWLSPRHIRILTVADRHEPFARELEKECRRQGFLCAVDATQESVGKKVRNAQLMQVNYILTVGDQEIENQMVNVRTRDNIVHGAMPLLDLLKILQEEKLGRLLSSPLSEKVNA